jgi:hypothetical protein
MLRGGGVKIQKISARTSLIRKLKETKLAEMHATDLRLQCVEL